MELLFILSLVITGFVLATISAGSAVDDIRKVRQEHKYQLQSASHRRRTAPLVTILLTTGDDSAVTKDAVENILSGSYRRLEIIVLCTPHQQASLQKVVKQISKRRRPVTVVTSEASLQATYERHGHGTIVTTLRDTDRLAVSAIERTVIHLTNSTALALRPDIVSPINYSSRRLLWLYGDGLAYFWKKLLNMTAGTADSSPPSFYQADAFRTEYTLPVGHYFTEDVVVSQFASSPSRPIIRTRYRHLHKTLCTLWAYPSASWYWRPFVTCVVLALIAAPAMLTYTLYLAMAAHQPLLLFVSLLLFITYVITGLWSRPGISLRNKICLSVLTPICVLPFYLATFVGAVMALGFLGHTAKNGIAGLMTTKKPLTS